MIQIEVCRGCGRPLFIHRVANMDVRLETDALDGRSAVDAIVDGRELWRVTPTSITPAKPDVLGALAQRGNTLGPHVVREHRCTAFSRPNTPSPVPGAADPKVEPQRPVQSPAAPTARSSAPRTPVSGARSAVKRRSEPTCDGCGQPCKDGTYAAIELGDLVVWAQHVERCNIEGTI